MCVGKVGGGGGGGVEWLGGGGVGKEVRLTVSQIRPGRKKKKVASYQSNGWFQNERKRKTDAIITMRGLRGDKSEENN